MQIHTRTLIQFERYLMEEEKSRATIEKYRRDLRCFQHFLNGKAVSKEQAIAYKEYLCGRYAASSVNSMLAALNCFLRFAGQPHCCVKPLKIQRQLFAAEDRELSKSEYLRLSGRREARACRC